MGLRLEDRWIWDSWVADDGDNYHLFYLQAPRSLGDPGERHHHATVGHAVSTDLTTWTVLPDALGPLSGSWDDLAIWTGSVTRDDDGLWRMYYTAISTRGYHLKDQRVGLVVSEDLISWRRPGDQPTLLPDGRWYKTNDEATARGEVASETWRDPLLIRDPGGDGWHLLVTARAVGAAPNDDGVIAHARSTDLVDWELQPPLCEPGQGFGQLEVVQIRSIDDTPVLVFTCHPQEMTRERRAQSGDYCTWSVPATPGAHPVLGPWDIGKARPFTAEPELFAAPLVQRRDGSWALVGFRNLEPQGTFSFEIMDPVGVHLDDGVLVADEDYRTVITTPAHHLTPADLGLIDPHSAP